MNSFFVSFLSIGVWSSAVILTLLAMRRLFSNKLSSGFFRLAWLVLAVRLVLPFDFSIPKAPIVVEIPKAIYVEPVKVNTDTDNFIQPPTSQPLFSEDKNPIQADKNLKVNINSIKPALPYIWLCVAAIYFAVSFISYLLYSYKLHKSRKDASEEFIGLSNICVYTSPLLSAPILCGYAFPTIYVPEKIYTRDEAQNIINHELLHYKQGDLWIQLLLLVAVSISWFNPMVYIMRKNAIFDIEMNVDEILLKNKSAEERLKYGKLIFSQLSAAKKGGKLMAHYNSGKNIKNRFKAILSTSLKSRGRILLAGIITLSVGASLLVSCAAKNDEPTAEPSIVSSQSSSSAPQSIPESDSQSSISAPQSIPESDSQSALQPEDSNEIFAFPLTKYTQITTLHSEANGTPAGSYGADISAEHGTAVYSVMDGTVIETQDDNVEDSYKHGKYAIIKNSSGVSFIYAHLSETLVKTGDEIKQSEQIGAVGSTGNSTGNHLHVVLTQPSEEEIAKLTDEQKEIAKKATVDSFKRFLDTSMLVKEAESDYDKWVNEAGSISGG